MKKTFRTIDIADALGISEGAVTSAANSKGWSCKNGLNIYQIIEIRNMPRRQRSRRAVDKREVEIIQMFIDALVDDDEEEADAQLEMIEGEETEE